MVALRQLTVLDLEPSSTHTLVVTATDRFGNTWQSNTETVTTPPKTDNTPPTAPTNLRLAPQTTTDEIWLDWDPSTDETDSQSLIVYEILINGVRDHRVIGGTDTIVYCPAVVPATFTVRALDTSGNVSARSNEIVFC